LRKPGVLLALITTGGMLTLRACELVKRAGGMVRFRVNELVADCSQEKVKGRP